MKKSVILTGNFRGIGKSIHSYLTANNYNVLGLDILNSDSIDLSDEKAIINFCTEIKSKNISIYAIVHCAAIQAEQNVLQTSRELLNSLFSTNVFSVYTLVQNLYTLLENPSSIILISSVHSKATSPGLSAYAASKAALSSLARSMALELGPQIRVNSICPGAIDTEMLRQGLSRSGDSDIAFKKLQESSPLKKIGTGEEVAKLVSFLINNELSSNITGQDIVIDSGILARLSSE